MTFPNLLSSFTGGVFGSSKIAQRFPLKSSAKVPPRINEHRAKKAQAMLSMRPGALISDTRPNPSVTGITTTGFTEAIDRRQLMLRGLETANTANGAAYLEVRGTYVAEGWKWKSTIPDAKRKAEVETLVRDTMDKASGQFCSFSKMISVLDYSLAVQGDVGVWAGVQDEPRAPTHGQLFFLPVYSDEIGQFYYSAPTTKKEIDGWDLNYFCGIYYDTVGNNIAVDYFQRKFENSWAVEPITISWKDFVFFVNTKRGEKRGIPAFASGWREISDDDQLQQLTLARAKAASTRAIVTTNGRGADVDAGLEFSEAGEGMPSIAHRPDMPGSYEFFQLPGEQTEIFNVSGGDKDNIEIREKSIRAFCNSVGFTYEFLINPNNSGGAATRLATSRDSGMIRKLRENLRPNLNRLAAITTNWLAAQGLLAPEECGGGFVCLTPLPVIDAGYDAKATKEAIAAGLEDQITVIEESGGDYKQVLANQTAFLVEAMKAANLGNLELIKSGLPPGINWQALAAPTPNPNLTANMPIYPGSPSPAMDNSQPKDSQEISSSPQGGR